MKQLLPVAFNPMHLGKQVEACSQWLGRNVKEQSLRENASHHHIHVQRCAPTYTLIQVFFLPRGRNADVEGWWRAHPKGLVSREFVLATVVVSAFSHASVLGSSTSCTIPEQQDAAAAAQEKPSSQLCLLTAFPPSPLFWK